MFQSNVLNAQNFIAAVLELCPLITTKHRLRHMARRGIGEKTAMERSGHFAEAQQQQNAMNIG
jgi:hypothetical protein